MHRQRIYIDASIVGGYFDEEFKDVTRSFFRMFEEGEVRFVISDLVLLELLNAPD